MFPTFVGVQPTGIATTLAEEVLVLLVVVFMIFAPQGLGLDGKR